MKDIFLAELIIGFLEIAYNYKTTEECFQYNTQHGCNVHPFYKYLLFSHPASTPLFINYNPISQGKPSPPLVKQACFRWGSRIKFQNQNGACDLRPRQLSQFPGHSDWFRIGMLPSQSH